LGVNSAPPRIYYYININKKKIIYKIEEKRDKKRNFAKISTPHLAN